MDHWVKFEAEAMQRQLDNDRKTEELRRNRLNPEQRRSEDRSKAAKEAEEFKTYLQVFIGLGVFAGLAVGAYLSYLFLASHVSFH